MASAKSSHLVDRLPKPRGRLTADAPLGPQTWFATGGPAEVLFRPADVEDLATFLAGVPADVPVTVLGVGSNLLVRDGGIRGAVIHPSGGAFDEMSLASGKGTIVAGAGVRLKKIASFAAANGIAGFEWMEGIPGNVGGALRMNAGAMGTETFDQVLRVTFLDEDGVIRTRERAEIEADYRNVPELSRNFALQAVFKGKSDQPLAIKQRIEDSRDKRRASQPVSASAGCIFRNPDDIPAGKLVDDLGLKGTVIGNAAISEIHGNFIVNQGGATATDILKLIETIRTKARKERGVELETEVKVIGEDDVVF